MIPLTSLDPRWVGAGGEGVFNADMTPAQKRTGVGLSFKCPCGKHDEYDRIYVGFANPLDGGPCHDPSRPKWGRKGETFETLVLSPSILRTDPNGCRWHGHVGGPDGSKPGMVTTC